MGSVTTKNGVEIHVPASAMRHMEAHPDALQLLEMGARLVDISENPAEGDVARLTAVFPHDIGRTGLVQAANVSASENALFAKRPGRKVWSRVTDRVGDMVPTLAIIAGFHGGKWILYTSFIGVPTHKEPHDRSFDDGKNREEFIESLGFWCQHALTIDDGFHNFEWMSWVDAIRMAQSLKS